MNFVSLFAGVGGFDLAFERAGMTCVGQVEIDTRCREVLATHWPDVPRFEDVHDVKASDLYANGRGFESVEFVVDEERTGRRSHPVSGVDSNGGRHDGTGSVDVLAGGFPCQDYSVAGKRGGLAGDRGALWWQFHRLIAECRPRWVVGENVPGLLSSNSGEDFGAIVGSLVELGYGVVWRVLDAQYFGVAQRRRRVFIVGHFGGIPRPEILAFAQGCAGDTPPIRDEGQAVTTVSAKWAKGTGGPSGDEVQNLIAYGFDWTQTWADPYQELSPPIRIGGTLENLAAPPAVFQGSVRRLTPLECERLQGFPDNWTASQSDTQRYRQMGNAVAVPVAEWIGKRLVAA